MFFLQFDYFIVRVIYLIVITPQLSVVIVQPKTEHYMPTYYEIFEIFVFFSHS